MVKLPLKPQRPAKKSVVRVAPLELTSPKVHVPQVQLVPQVVVARRARLMPRPRQKENNYAATSAQEISQRAERP
jgi:hypothetical protein